MTLNRLDNLTHRNAAGSVVSFFDLDYDAASRITRITDIDGVTDYSYDDTDQLTVADHSDPANPDETYAFDANGNRISSHLHGSGYVTGPGNRLLSDGTFNYDYDNEGNLIRRTEIATGNYREFLWDHRNRLIAVFDRDAASAEIQRVEFTYDAFDRRISKSVDTNPQDMIDAVLTHFVYDRDDVILDFVDEDGAAGPNPLVLAQRYLHGPAVDQILAQEDSAGNVLWHLTDHLGTVRDLADNNGAVTSHITYDSFGSAIVESGQSLDTRYLFTGREFDSETGLYSYRTRYYDVALGRFLAEDTIGFAGEDLNLFRYVRNSPLDSADPFGLLSQEERRLLDEKLDAGEKSRRDYETRNRRRQLQEENQRLREKEQKENLEQFARNLLGCLEGDPRNLRKLVGKLFFVYCLVDAANQFGRENDRIDRDFESIDEVIDIFCPLEGSDPEQTNGSSSEFDPDYPIYGGGGVRG